MPAVELAGPLKTSTRKGAALLQRRVSRFGLVASLIAFFALVIRVAVGLALGWQIETDATYLCHAEVMICFAGVWLLCRSGAHSPRYSRAVEFFGMLAAALALDAMGLFIPPLLSPELILSLVTALILIARVIYVPSSVIRTLALCVALGVPLVASVYWRYLSIDAVWWESIGGEWGRTGTAAGIAQGKALNATLWWTAFTILCTSASKTVYGLRSEAQKAKQLGQYTLHEKLGEGAMGVVYRAHHAMLRRPTAVKLLQPKKVGEETVLRFEREVQLTARLTHPNTITIYDYGRTPDGTFYYAMELLDGASLDVIVAVDGAQPAERVLHIMDQVAAALGEAHSIGLIHRDIKPENIILTEQGGEPDVAKVLDFGLVKDTRGEGQADLSQAGSVVGTPFFMSPETILAYHEVDGRSDLYSLGCVAYFLLTGKHVFEGENVGEVVSQHVRQPPVPPSERLGKPVPEGLERAILACLEKDPADRLQTASHLRARLWACTSHGNWNADRAHRWWQEHGELVRAAAPGPVHTPAGRTIAIDMWRRPSDGP